MWEPLKFFLSFLAYALSLYIGPRARLLLAGGGAFWPWAAADCHPEEEAGYARAAVSVRMSGGPVCCTSPHPRVSPGRGRPLVAADGPGPRRLLRRLCPPGARCGVSRP